METRKQLIAAVKLRMGPANDSPDFIPVLKKAGRARQDIRLVTGDKGYDAERNHEYVHEVIGGRSVIPVRRGDDPDVRIMGRYRKRQRKHFDSRAYRQRVKVETVNSVQKRTMGSHVSSRKTGQRHRELVFRALAYNAKRMETLFHLLFEGFYKAGASGEVCQIHDRGKDEVSSTARCASANLSHARKRILSHPLVQGCPDLSRAPLRRFIQRSHCGITLMAPIDYWPHDLREKCGLR